MTMDVKVTISVPPMIYEFYKSAAENVTGGTVEEVMSVALITFLQLTYEDMKRKGELSNEFWEQYNKTILS